ncbi:MAG TPA: hypothetical protein VFM51_08005 [Solirubrobacterales bacterium]|nr:hypothetical protein [Solirubrobacterales bacterium]
MSVALAALVIAGCGGGDETTEATTPTTEEAQTLTKEELIEQGDAICAEVNAAVGALGAEAAEADVPDTIEKSANLYLGMVERLQDLGTPEDDDGSYAKFMEAAEVFAMVEGEVKLATEREDSAALGEAATKAAPALEEFRSQAAIYGFEECSEEASAPSSAGGEPSEALEGEEGGVEAEPGVEEAPEEGVAPEEEPAPETGGAGGGTAPESSGGESGGGSESGGVGPG